jgi:hypothetical protein
VRNPRQVAENVRQQSNSHTLIFAAKIFAAIISHASGIA